MASQFEELHLLMFPLMAQGHMIPMVDIARLLAQRGATITIVTTNGNAARFEAVLSRAVESGLKINLVGLKFPCEEAGLPEGHENLDAMTSPDLVPNFFRATFLLLKPAQKLAKELVPRPNCVVSDMFLPWTINIARMLGVPRVSFNGVNCFCLLCFKNLGTFNVREKISSETEYFVIPGIPDQIEITKAQIPGALAPNLDEFFGYAREAEAGSYGMIVNSFEELEPEYAKRYKKERNGKAWCVGPASLCNKELLDKAQRGNKPIVDEHECLKLLGSWEPSSVVYVCLGSLCNLTTPQLVELGLGLEASNKPFIWVIKGRNIKSEELEKWIAEDGFEERIKGRGLLLRGWAPQVLILSHPALGGFLTHCGWNSTLEGICAGVPLITWPLFADQFFNEKLAAQVLKIAVTLGVEEPMTWGEEEKIGVKVKRETIKSALESLMDEEDQESRERRERARKLGEMATRAVEEGGSTHNNITLFLEEIMKIGNGHQQED